MICRFALNTAFIQDNYYEFAKNTVDPDSLVKDERISWDFKIECYFRDFCHNCDSSMPLDNLCQKCVQQMGSEVQCWKIIKDILDVSYIINNLNTEPSIP
jgi:C2 domain of PTEN tumour-suppressor protein